MRLSRTRPILAPLVLLLGLLGVVLPAGAQTPVSTVNPNIPSQNSPLASGPIRANFSAANTDINILYTTTLPLAGGTMTGRLITATPTLSNAGLTLPHGLAPTSPNNGDIWTTTSGLFVQVNGTTIGPLATSAGSPVFTSPVVINLTGGVLPTVLSGTVLRGANVNSSLTRIELDAYGTSVNPIYSCVLGRGTAAAPTAVQSGDELCSLNAWGYTGAGVQSATSAAAVRMLASQNWSSGNQGTAVDIATTANGSTTLASVFRVQQSGGLALGSANVTQDAGNGNFILGSLRVIGANVGVSSNGQGSLGTSSANGLILQGQGSSNDVTLQNKSGTIVCDVPTGTSGLNCNSLNSNTIAGSQFSVAGVVSAAAWTTSGIRFVTTPTTLTDTTSTGTVATAYTSLFGGDTIAATNAGVTFTTYYTAYFKVPIAGTNVSLPNGPFGVGADSAQFGISNPVVVGSSGNLTVQAQLTVTGHALVTGSPLTPASNGQISIGATATAGAIIIGQGSSTDITLQNKAGGAVCSIPTGGTQFNCTTIDATTYALTTQLFSQTPPTLTAGFCSSPSVSQNNGNAAYEITIGSSCAAGTGTITLPAASHNWKCDFADVTNPANNIIRQTGGTATTVTVQDYNGTTGVAQNMTAADVIRANCVAY